MKSPQITAFIKNLEHQSCDAKDNIQILEKWIEEGEEKIRDIEKYIEQLSRRIDEAENKARFN